MLETLGASIAPTTILWYNKYALKRACFSYLLIRTTDWRKAVSVTGLLALAIIGLDFTTSLLMPRQRPRILVFGDRSSRDVCWVFPGFSNPAKTFGEGMSAVLGPDKLILVLDCGTSTNDDLMYDTLMDFMEAGVGPAQRITIYGHSRGGQVGMLVRQRYLHSGSKFGPICATVLDCSPMRPSSLQTPMPALITRLIVLLLWPGVLLRGVIYLGNLLSRNKMPILHDESCNHELYKRYSNGIALFNTRAWRAQMLYMLRFKASRVEYSEDSTVFYVHSKDPQLDKLVRQVQAITQWREKFPHLVLVPADVSHAWPLEQPGTYQRLFQDIWRLCA